MPDATAKASEFGIAAAESEVAGALRLGWARSPWILLGVLVCSYIGIYLCRKNLSVAVPLLQSEWGVTKSQIGWLASVSTVAYAAGKILFGPIIDRFGGRVSLIASMVLVAGFGALGGLAPGLGALTLLYSMNRLAGSASWGAMVKLTPGWFSSCRLPLALGILSCSYVFGGALATAFAGFVADATDNNWRLILSLPSGVLLLFLLVALVLLPNDTARKRSQEKSHPPAFQARKPVQSGFFATETGRYRLIFRSRQFQVTLALSFVLTFVRETFNFWTIDFFRTEGGAAVSSAAAAMLSVPFDLAGSVGILLLGYWLGRVSKAVRSWILFGDLLLLGIFLALLPAVAQASLWVASLTIGVIGFLVYGPYSLLGGVLSVEINGPASAATVSGLVDGTGYVAGVLSGSLFGKALMLGGYTLGFHLMAVMALFAAVVCLLLHPRTVSAREVSPTGNCLN